MTERLPDDRLAEIRKEIEDDSYRHSYDSGRAARELLAEVDRMRALEVPATFLEAPADSVTPEQIAEWQAAFDKIVQQPQKQKLILLPSQAERLDASSYHIRAEAIPNADGLEAAVLVDHAPCMTTIYGNGAGDTDHMYGDALFTLIATHHCDNSPVGG